MGQDEQRYQGDSRGKVAAEGPPIVNPIAIKGWPFYDLKGIVTWLGSDLKDFLVAHGAQADLYTAYDLARNQAPGTTFDIALRHSRGDVLVDPLGLPSPQLEKDWQLTEASLFLPLAFNTETGGCDPGLSSASGAPESILPANVCQPLRRLYPEPGLLHA